ncbi:MAG: sigma 54-interacting transcriptional regulator [Chlorobium sp.]|uniref:sigma 54-interacting transcriptional regulator n=1 Tax=Chlorobium sp. TaxID=1095 RepID=UPI0025C52FF3|nr:sigma 54-interacting transcriptional regulator [Chlorobium sp.]MCF8215680.1 sigma 54-interacting transcriptional regulator [Chlorobium sp.]MCF8271923.1 sigma 54-interacting transcriptional regulator [Chlorobium sp.]MCF8286889.1 sigma 54-interacting transcriptional regulator [Chlorobium sp.]MCF8291870.1 sigma 54-interacting transcriptional regulator [Chlorobium sp.]MCF8384491.1 sigma 54-interacting transcriptional regulator [Chlorobium sp.]
MLTPQKTEDSSISLLAEVSRTVTIENDIGKVLRLVLFIMSEHMNMLRGMITILNRDSGEIVINESFGLSEEEKERGRYRIGEGIIGQVVKTGKPVLVPNIDEEPLFLDRTRSRRKARKDDLCFICIPIKSGTEIIGTLSADRHIEPHLPDDPAKRVQAEEQRLDTMQPYVDLLSIIASMISQAVKLTQLAHEENASNGSDRSHLSGSHTARISHTEEKPEEEQDEAERPTNIIGNTKPMLGLFRMIDKIAKTNATTLILGESGVGKELVASAIHFKSRREEKPFIKFNCAALPESIVESELFGHEKGAFTGASVMRQGRFELAHAGTLFLDEIGELSLQIQAKLLRILQEKEFERVGGSKTIKTDVRIIAATNRNLENLIRDGMFREDLYYRLNIFPITVPPLRERKTDILLLADYFVEKYNRINQKGIRRISTTSIDMLMRYHWPGNVRELENCIERAVILSEDNVIHGYHLPPSLQTAESSGTPYTGSLQQKLDSIENEMIIEALKRTKGNMSRAASQLGLSDRIMGLRVKKFNIDYH